MKRLALTFAIILGLASASFGQSIWGKSSYDEIWRDDPVAPGIVFPNHDSGDDFDADPAPLGSGIAVLVGLGAAYAIAKKRKE